MADLERIIEQLNKDRLGRISIDTPLRDAITHAFDSIPKTKADGTPARAALLLVFDGQVARLQLAARLDDDGDWKVAGGVGVPVRDLRAAGIFVAVQGVW